MKPHLVAALVQGAVSPLEVGFVAEVFGRPPPEFGLRDWYQLEICSSLPGAVRSHAFDLFVQEGLEALDQADTIVIPSWDNSVCPEPRLIRSLRAAAERGARLVSLFSGTFLLGRAGLLDNRRVAAHWLHANDLAMRCPAAYMDSSILYHDDGQLITGAGGSSSLDLLLYIVRKDHGLRVSNALARRLVAPPHRGGDQAQKVARPMPRAQDGHLGHVFDYLRTNANDPPSREEIAHIARMSPRNLNKKFRQAVGCTVLEWQRREKIAIAKELLEDSTCSIEDVWKRAGFETVGIFRRAFLKHEGMLPKDYRKICRANWERQLRQSSAWPAGVFNRAKKTGEEMDPRSEASA